LEKRGERRKNCVAEKRLTKGVEKKKVKRRAEFKGLGEKTMDSKKKKRGGRKKSFEKSKKRVEGASTKRKSM